MRRLQMKARYAFERERRESSSSVKDDDINMRVSSKEIDFPYAFGDHSSTPPDDKMPVVDAESAYSGDSPTTYANGHRNTNSHPHHPHHQVPPSIMSYQVPLEVINSYSMAYDSGTHPPSAWNDMVTRALPHMTSQRILGNLPP